MRKYDNEFKGEAVRKIYEGQSVASLSRELGVSENHLHAWKRKVYDGSTDAERELTVLKKRLREVEMERDILKKAAMIFGRGT